MNSISNFQCPRQPLLDRVYLSIPIVLRRIQQPPASHPLAVSEARQLCHDELRMWAACTVLCRQAVGARAKSKLPRASNELSCGNKQASVVWGVGQMSLIRAPRTSETFFMFQLPSDIPEPQISNISSVCAACHRQTLEVGSPFYALIPNCRSAREPTFNALQNLFKGLGSPRWTASNHRRPCRRGAPSATSFNQSRPSPTVNMAFMPSGIFPHLDSGHLCTSR